MLNINVVQNGRKNLILLIQGTIPKEGEQIITKLAEYDGAAKLRMHYITFALEKPISLWWEGGGPILPLDGRGQLDLAWFSGFKKLDEGLSGDVELHGVAGSLVMLALEFIKQGA